MQTQKIYEDFSNKEIAKEIIINTLNEILELKPPAIYNEDKGKYSELESVEKIQIDNTLKDHISIAEYSIISKAFSFKGRIM